jgi:hypothetical protein
MSPILQRPGDIALRDSLTALGHFEMTPLTRLSSPLLGNGNGRRRSVHMLQQEGPLSSALYEKLREQRQMATYNLPPPQKRGYQTSSAQTSTNTPQALTRLAKRCGDGMLRREYSPTQVSGKIGSQNRRLSTSL